MNHLRWPLFLAAALFSCHLSAQIQFINRNDLLGPDKHFSGVAIAVLDMNGDGLDDIARMDQGFYLTVAYQTAPNQSFVSSSGIDMDNGSQWGMCAGDLDNNGFPDVLTGGAYDGIKIAMANAGGTAFDLLTLTGPGTFVQGVNFADINNDGWLDAFVCHDDGASRIFGNDGAGNLVYQPLWIDLATVPASDNSGNYGSVWSDVDNDGDLDLYIAHCRQGVSSPTNPTRINQLFLNNGDGTYTQDVTNASGLRIGAQSWTADFGDFDNDGDFDCFITNHDVTSQLLENDGAGHFTDITIAAGLKDSVTGTPIQGVFRDFDNDGFVDILVAGSRSHLFHNNGDKTFSRTSGLFDNNDIESFALGDLNHDGFQDIYAGYAEIFTDPSNTPDVLWLNTGNDNHYFGLNLRGVQSNRNAVGAKVILYSELGAQVREVRAGESYGIMNSMQIHFGLGQISAIDSVLVFWPSGIVDTLKQGLALDQYLTVEEGGCVIPQVTAFSTGSTVICSGEEVTLFVTDAYKQYLWSTGDTTATITVGDEGNYSVTVTTNEGCSTASSVVRITVDPVEIPAIAAIGDSVFCAGGFVELVSSAASAWQWNTGDTTQSIVITEPGSYYVTTQGLCDQFESAAIEVTVLDSPVPLTMNDTVLLQTPATLTASGGQVNWYDAPVGGNLLFTGDTFMTGPLTADMTYWASATTVYDQPNEFVGMVNHQGSTIGDPQVNGAIYFDCLTPFRLSKVKVYADIAAERKIDLLNTFGQVIQTKTVFIPSGSSVIDLGFDVPVGQNLSLETDAQENIVGLGTYGPQLYRSSQSVMYPYTIPNVVRLTSSPFGLNRYYYFFNWEVDYYEHTCTSDRVPVSAVVDTINGTSTPGWAQGLSVYPNPGNGAVTVAFGDFEGGDLNVSLLDVRGARLSALHKEQAAGEGALYLDFTAVPKGMYWLELATRSGVVRRKLVLH
ncbi:MAG: FG-GAP-like repeat-containing protein [Saprospiraceae bacterium]